MLNIFDIYLFNNLITININYTKKINLKIVKNTKIKKNKIKY